MLNLEKRQLSRVKKLKYIVVLFTSEHNMEHVIYTQMGAASTIMWTLWQTVMVKSKLLIYQLICFPTLNDW